jgi:hypothetical protein
MQIPPSPWPEVDPGTEDTYPIDWRRLFYGDRTPYPDDFWDDALVPPTGGPGERLDPGRAPDVLAWYQPIHFYGPDWGIYIREDGITRVAARIMKAAAGRMPSIECVRAAIATLFLHEAHHHRVECFGLRLLAAREQPVYPAYIGGVYNRLSGTDDLLEEALANAESWRRLDERTYAIGDIAAVRRYLEHDFSLAPPGYRRAGDYLTDPDFRAGQADLLNQVAAGSPRPTQDVADWMAVNRMYQALFDVRQNFWTVVPKGTRPALPIVTPPRYETRDLVRVLESAGYRERHGTKHRKFTSQQGPTVHLSRRPEQPPHVARHVASALGIPVAELS